MTDLKQLSCGPVAPGGRPYTRAEAEHWLGQVRGWTLDDTATEIHRTYGFKNYYETVAFVNALAWIAHREDHHPDLEVGYKRCRVRLRTHSIGGLSQNDFICAAKINALVGE